MKTCLVIDDSRVIRKVACRILQDLTFETEEAENGAVALEVCRRKMPDVILLDWNMPKLSGIDTLRTLRQAGNNTPVIMVTTEAEKSRVIEAIKTGANDYLIKPFSPDQLAAKVKGIVAAGK